MEEKSSAKSESEEFIKGVPVTVVKQGSGKADHSKSFANREHVYKNHGFYAFRYVCMLLAGAGFLACLIATMSLTISKWLRGDDFSVSRYMGSVYATLATAVLIFGAIHLLLSMTVGGNWKAKDGENRKYPVVMSVIYSVGIGSAIIGFLIMSVGTLFGSALELNSAKGKDVIEQALIALTAICILGFALVYKLNLVKKINKSIYAIVMGAIAVCSVVLFIVFPAGEVRNTIHDENVVEDLRLIETEINSYYKDKGTLPKALSDLKFEKEGLHYKVKDYDYEINETNCYGYSNCRSASSSYEICAVFKTSTSNDDVIYDYKSYSSSSSSDVAPYSSSYYYHKEGRECFYRTASGYSRYDPVYYNQQDLDELDI